MPLKILLVDDHIMITNMFKIALSDLKINTEITTINTLENAHNFFFAQNKTVDIVLLDLSMPSYSEKNINNGEDLAKLIRVNYPKIKIIIATGYCEPIRLNSIIKDIFPEGILEKCDIDNNLFLYAFNKIIDGEVYKSKTIENSITSNLANNIYLDPTNRLIIKLISFGIKTIDIPLHLPITLSGVNKRKLKIKQFLNIDSGCDEDIIREAKKIGII